MEKTIWTPEMDNFLRENYTKMSYAKMGEALGIPFRYRNRVVRRCKELGIERFNGTQFNESFFDEWSSDMAYVLGFTAADGSINYQPGKHYDLCWRVSSKDKDFLEMIRNLLSAQKPLRYYRKTDSYSLTLSSRHVCERLMDLGIIPNKSNLSYHVSVLDEYLLDFVRGMSDGDGTIYYANRERSPYISWRLFSNKTNEYFMLYLQEKLYKNTGLKVRLKSHHDNMLVLELTCSESVGSTIDHKYCGCSSTFHRKLHHVGWFYAN